MRLPTLLPLLLFVLVGAALAVGLTLNPREIPSALIGQRIVLLDRFTVAPWVRAVRLYRPEVLSEIGRASCRERV